MVAVSEEVRLKLKLKLFLVSFDAERRATLTRHGDLTEATESLCAVILGVEYMHVELRIGNQRPRAIE